LATIGKEAFDDRTCRIPLGDRDLRADLHKLKKVTGPTGVPRFVADSDSEGHADRTWAGFLAMYAAKDGAQIIEYQSLGKRESRTGEDYADDYPALTDIGFGTISGGTDFHGF